MDKQHSIVYVMRHIDIGGHVDVPYKKIGITGAGNATLSSRLQQISNTKSPIKAQCIAAWKHDDARSVENAIHLILDDNRVEGEWFYDKDDTLVERMQPIMELVGATEVVIGFILEEGADAQAERLSSEGDVRKDETIQTTLVKIIDRVNAKTVVEVAGVSINK